MSEAEAPASAPSIWTRRRLAGGVAQAAALAAVALVAWVAAGNLAANLGRLAVNTGFGFLGRPAGFAISQHLIDYSESSTYLRALEVAVLNTLLLAAVSIVLATPLGFALGLARRSSNGLLRALAAGYVELLRNLPLLLQLFFWYFAVLRALPAPRASLSLFGVAFLNVRGLILPRPLAGSGFDVVLLGLLLGVGLAVAAVAWTRRRRVQTGEALAAWIAVPPLLVIPPLVTAAISGPPLLHWELPVLRGFNFAGGLVVQPEFVAMALALSLYSAAYIAEIVRAGIDAVSRGQVEAARALGLRSGAINAKIVVPQALRVIVPPLGNEYLRLFRNTTLAAAIGYPDLTLIFAGTAVNQTAQPVEVMLIVCACYLAINLAVSAAINAYNRRIGRSYR
ncbi:MAG TPA: ABC transporter permease subunit [Stellaceae bacterium]|nr:ABC transporter permease subunit [Stellaceae bacterium]